MVSADAEESHVALSACAGRFEMSMFHTFDAGNTVHGVPGTPAPVGPPSSATRASEAATARVRRRILGANHRLQGPRHRGLERR